MRKIEQMLHHQALTCGKTWAIANIPKHRVDSLYNTGRIGISRMVKIEQALRLHNDERNTRNIDIRLGENRAKTPSSGINT